MSRSASVSSGQHKFGPRWTQMNTDKWGAAFICGQLCLVPEVEPLDSPSETLGVLASTVHFFI